MAVADRVRGMFGRWSGVTALAEALAEERQTRTYLEESVEQMSQVAWLAESIGDLENRLFEPGWIRFLTLGDVQFSREGMAQLAAICRLMAIKNPLIKRGLALRSAYVWGSGVTIRAGDRKPAAGAQDLNEVIQSFLDDNEETLSGATAKQRNEHSLGTDGSVFFSLFTSPITGAVQVRVLLYDEINDIITDPQDRSRRWYYKRIWIDQRFNTATGRLEEYSKTGYYPDVDYRPAIGARVPTIAGKPVYWDAPVVQVKVNAPEGWLFGIPDSYAAIDWASAYREFLEDWARLVKSLSRFSWRATSPATRQAAVKSRLSTAPTLDPVTGKALDVGATAIMDPLTTFEPISKSGAVTVDAESGRPLAMMVASALGVPVTMLLADPGQTGARAVAETLDQPTELEMGQRRDVWAEALRKILNYVIDSAARAPKGSLKGLITREGTREKVTLAGDTNRTVTIDWPDLDEIEPKSVVEAIQIADGLGYLPELTIARLVLIALGVDDVDAVLDEITDDEGRFKPPYEALGIAAVNALRGGEDPAAMFGGGEEPTPADEPATEAPT